MKEIYKTIIWEADDGTRFESKETCGIYELMIKNPLAFLQKFYKFFDIYSPLDGAEKRTLVLLQLCVSNQAND